VPELFRKKFMAIRERFRVAPFFARAFYTLQEEFDIAGGLRAVADAHLQVAIGSIRVTPRPITASKSRSNRRTASRSNRRPGS
jgi:hypothetical protein